MKKQLALATPLFFLLTAALSADGVVDTSSQWIWTRADRRPHQYICLRTTFNVRERLRSAELILAAEYCHSALYVNDERVVRGEPYGPLIKIDIAARLTPGENSLGVCCRSVDGPAAVMARLELLYIDGGRETIATGPAWRAAAVSSLELPRWPRERLAWGDAVSLGKVVAHRWGLQPDTTSITPVDDYEQWRRATKAEAGADPKTFQVASGFEVDLIRSAADDEDSWVSLARDPRGRWIIGMEKQGLLRLTLPPSDKEPVRVEHINDTLRECRGLVFAHDSLYAMANGDKSLFRLRDTDDDDQFDKIDKLAEFAGDTGHGRNQLTLGPDGRVWGVFGDSVFEPESATKLPPALANPTRAEKTRSGFVARFNEDATQIDIVVRGLRNPYGIDFNEQGDLFTYDADAEYDMGTSWYRPTRVNHLLPGGDYGWRRVTRDWPPYFPDRADTPQPTLDIGKGSPTSVAFGTHSNFPLRYRDALFVLDWAYGRILAVHLTPRGASYFASAETFLRGQPLNVTDVEFGGDGAMYFITGGRGTQSALYRVRYVGEPVKAAEPTRQQMARDEHAQRARKARRELESLLKTPQPEMLDLAWPQLNNDDPWIRHAARVAVESVPPQEWRERAQKEDRRLASNAANIAWQRADPNPPCISVAYVKPSEQAASELGESFFIMARSLANDDCQDEPGRADTLKQLRSLYPHESPQVNHSLARILSQYPDKQFVAKTLALLEEAPTQRETFHYLFVLRNVADGWTPQRRQTYFHHLKNMDDFVGGEGLPAFRKLIRQEALAALPKDERASYENVLTAKSQPWLAELPPSRTKLVRKWTVDELAKAWTNSKTQGDPANGQKIFAVARCIVCHRCGTNGGASGPDLTSVAQRFSPRDILTSIVEPSRVISEKYIAETLQLESGRVVTGRIAPGDFRSSQLDIVTNLLQPETTTTIVKADIVARNASPISPMPTGLVDTLSEQEVVDLLAFVLLGSSSRASASSP